MSIPNGVYKLGPEQGALSIRTGRTGAAAKAGHNLLIVVTAWEATLELAESSAGRRLTLDADAGSVLVREGTGGMQSLGEDDKAGIKQTIDEQVLRRREIRFRSTWVHNGVDGESLAVQGDLTLVGATRPVDFELRFGAGGELSASARLKQTDWGIKPYSALFGALKVADEVEVALAGRLPAGDQSR